MILWSICFLLSWCFITYKLHLKTKATTSDRKVFHVLASIVFIPGLIWEPVLLYTASGAAFALLTMLEVRLNKLNTNEKNHYLCIIMLINY